MSRIRLTKRMKAEENDIPFPGLVGQPDRPGKPADGYYNYDPEVVEAPDLRHEWKNDQRDSIGFGIPEAGGPTGPTVASIRVAANKAVRLAVLLLGEKSPEDVIEEQAKDFMAMGSKSLDASLSRFAKTQKFYAEDKAEEAPVEEKAEEKKAADKSEEKAEEAPAEKKAADEAPEAEKESEAAPAKEAADEKEDTKQEACKASLKQAEEDVQLSESDEDVTTQADDADPDLAKALEGLPTEAADETEDEGDVAPSKTAKKGIRKLGGQPIVASSNGGEDEALNSLWNSAPDVSELFR